MSKGVLQIIVIFLIDCTHCDKLSAKMTKCEHESMDQTLFKNLLLWGVHPETKKKKKKIKKINELVWRMTRKKPAKTTFSQGCTHRLKPMDLYAGCILDSV